MEKKIDFVKPMMYISGFMIGDILAKGYIGNYGFAIISYGVTPKAYVKIPIHSPIYHDYKQLFMSEKAGGRFGITYTESQLLGMSGHWVGWDYDYPFIDWTPCTQSGHQWTTEEILIDVEKTVQALSKMLYV